MSACAGHVDHNMQANTTIMCVGMFVCVCERWLHVPCLFKPTRPSQSSSRLRQLGFRTQWMTQDAPFSFLANPLVLDSYGSSFFSFFRKWYLFRFISELKARGAYSENPRPSSIEPSKLELDIQNYWCIIETLHEALFLILYIFNLSEVSLWSAIF